MVVLLPGKKQASLLNKHLRKQHKLKPTLHL